ncbi:MAG TPA: hypothetical protein VK430_01440 [Xanthobacteraceae bacterium]|nr:hypothetical protein [Xanthobacteraceae bacterium]
MPTYLSPLLSGDQDVLRWALLGGAVTGGLAVGIGIFWEAHKLTAATALVLVGVVVEAICTIFLFVIDESISRQQKEQIEQMLAHRKLGPEQKMRISSALAPYSPGEFVTATVPEDEAWGFVMEIAAALKADGWKWLPCAGGGTGVIKPLDDRPASCTSILDHIEIQTSPDLEKLGPALAEAIREPSIIGMDKVEVIINPNMRQRLVIVVGTKR